MTLAQNHNRWRSLIPRFFGGVFCCFFLIISKKYFELHYLQGVDGLPHICSFFL
jgi:hypothetical protein